MPARVLAPSVPLVADGVGVGARGGPYLLRLELAEVGVAVVDVHVVATLDDALVGGANDALAALELFEAVCSPACHARRGEHGRAQVNRDAEHVVHEARVQVDVGAQDLACALLLCHDLWRHAFDVLEELELALELGALGQTRGVLGR